jgi:BNR repeat-containing family member
MLQLPGGRRWRRTVVSFPITIAAVAAVTAGAISAPAYAEHSAEALVSCPASTPPTTLMTVATNVAARSDRRPVAGGLYDSRVRTTFISWAGRFEDNYVQAYDHRAATWSTPVRVADGGNDTHNYPTMIQANDGHLLVFRGMHNRELWYARSPRPHSIEGTWTDTNIPAGLGATYPMPFKAADGSIFVFIRETAGDFDNQYPQDFRPMKYVRSTDNGRTWRSSGALTGEKWNIAPQTRTDNMNEIYIGQMRYEPATLLRPERVVIVYTLAGGGPEGHLHDRYHRNIYYTYFSPRNLHFYSATGRDLGVKIDDPEQERHLKVAQTPLQMPNPHSPDYIQLVGTTMGAPFVVWMQFDAAAVLHTYAAVRMPTGWRTTKVASGLRVREMEQIDPMTWRVYTTSQDVAKPEITTYTLTAGMRWSAEATIPTPRAVQRIEVIEGYRDPARILISGASSARPAEVADGDIYVAGATITH